MEVEENVTKYFHGGPASVHFTKETTSCEVLGFLYYEHTHFKDVWAYVKKSRTFQLSSKRDRKTSIPLQAMSIQRPSLEWGIDIVLEINPRSTKKHKLSSYLQIISIHSLKLKIDSSQ